MTDTAAAPSRELAVAVDARALAHRSRAELDELFGALHAPAPHELAGDLRGVQLDLMGLGGLPAAVRAMLLAPLRGPLGPWRGKRFDGDRGVNLWRLGPLRRSFGRFRAATGAALDGSGPCLRLDYDVPENPLPLRGILGEVRHLGPGLFLARMNWRAGSGHGCVLYFTLAA